MPPIEQIRHNTESLFPLHIVTETGMEVMSVVPRTVEDIEAWMAGEGEVTMEDLPKTATKTQ